jgi:hypothetical protein
VDEWVPELVLRDERAADRAAKDEDIEPTDMV